VATESWAPNVAVAAQRLRPLGIPVVQTEGAPDNVAQAADEMRGHLPFRSAALDLVTSRHESYVASEVARILVPGGRFLTQQVGHGCEHDFHRLLGLPVPPMPDPAWRLPFAVAQVAAAGLDVLSSDRADERLEFHDVGALAWYLKSIPWTVPGFTIDAFRSRLAVLHAQIAATGPLVVRLPHFWLDARKLDHAPDLAPPCC
jgi:hypothetical protein